MNPDIEFRWLTDEEKILIGSEITGPIVIAVLNNQIISAHDWTTEYRYKNCSSCIGNCVQGNSVVWTRKEFRRQGIFKAMYLWAIADAGWDKDYAGGSMVPVDGVAIAWRYELPTGTVVYDPTQTLRDGNRRIEEWIAEISPLLGFDN